MKIPFPDIAQGSLEWLQLRAGIPTASEFDQLVTPKFKIRTGEMPRSYLARKLAEKWQEAPLAGFQSLDMEFGNILEDEAKPFYELTFNEPIQSVSFCTTDDGRVGCSPDGLIDPDGGIEIKCPEPNTHVKYLLNGDLPDDYAPQVHGSMYVTGRPWWKFMSYRRHFPPVILLIERDDEIQKTIGEALDMFLEQFDAGWKKLCEINGGPPKRAETIKPISPNPEHDPDDIIP
jgi:hypothetical protein